MNTKIKQRNSRKLWDRLRLIYDNINLIGTQLKTQFNNFNVTYRNINQYYSQYFSRNPSEINDLIHISSLKSNSNSSIYKVLLEDNDFKHIDLQLSVHQSLFNLHHILTFDVVKILARDHLEYFQQSRHNRGFNKVLQSINDARIAFESLEKTSPSEKTSCYDSNLPFHEKLWYLYCLVEREIFSTCYLFESINNWEKNLIKRSKSPESENDSLPPIDYRNKQITFIKNIDKCKNLKPPKICNKIKSESNTNYWQDNLRNHSKLKIENSTSEMSTETIDSLNLNRDLKICKWNFKEPAESSRTFRPLCNKTFLLKNKRAVSKPHSKIKPYLSKISINSDMSKSYDERKFSFTEIDLSSGQIVDVNQLHRTDKKPDIPKYQELQKFNKKLSDLQETIDQLIADRDNIEQLINNPLRNQVQKSMEWLKTIYFNKSNFIQITQNEINHLKAEKSLFLQNQRKK